MWNRMPDRYDVLIFVILLGRLFGPVLEWCHTLSSLIAERLKTVSSCWVYCQKLFCL